VRSAAFLLIAASVASAAPQVDIKAQSQISQIHLHKELDGVHVTGKLVDKLTGDALPSGQHVRIRLGDGERAVQTRQDGGFDAVFPDTGGPQEVTLTFGGTTQIESAHLSLTADPDKSAVELAIKKVRDDPKGAMLRVDATSEEGQASLAVQVELATPGKNDWHALPGHATTSQPFLLARKDAGGPGNYLVRATFTGDDVHQRATAEGTLELTAGTTTSMDTKATSLRYEDDLVVTGYVVDDDGRPVARAAMTLVTGDRRLAQGATTDEGSYRFKVEAKLLGDCNARPCTFPVQAQADPGSAFVRPSRSQPAQIKVAAPQPVPISYTVAAFAITGLAAAAFFAARSKPWRRLRRPAPPAEVPSQEGERGREDGGLVVAKPGIVSTLRGRYDDGFSGVVRDTVRGRPIAQAVVCLQLGETEREVRTGADGGFAIEHLGVGEWRAEVAASGHVTEKFVVSIPHRGELRGVRVDLVPVRERVFQLYRRAAEPVLPEARLWGVWSPRQIVDHVRAKRPSPALADLTDFVEEIYFSPRLAAETVLVHASERVDRAIQERARR
jgi:hypothetical protein